VQPGQAAGIGFWHNKNGQALIDSLNGGPNAIQLGNWLAAAFPNIFGTGAGANNLAGKTNAQVAAIYLQKFSAQGPKLDAQVMATALAVYVTTPSLAGTIATSYGFKVTQYGLGGTTFNVGSDGAAVGHTNGTVMTVMDILLATNALCAGDNGLLYGGDTARRNAANDLYDAINGAGGIS
jgi:hypothetical protein